MSKRKKHSKVNSNIHQSTTEQGQDASQVEMLSASDVETPAPLTRATEQSYFEKKFKKVCYVCDIAATCIECFFALTALIVVGEYLILGVFLHNDLYLSRIYGLIKFLQANWIGALLIFPLLFIKTFLKKIRLLTKFSAAGTEVETRDESLRA